MVRRDLFLTKNRLHKMIHAGWKLTNVNTVKRDIYNSDKSKHEMKHTGEKLKSVLWENHENVNCASGKKNIK